jgi:hypothetical protein
MSLCCHQVLEQLCKDVQAQAVLYQESIRNVSELEDTTGVELYPAAAGGKARPMVVIKQVRPLHHPHALGCTGRSWGAGMLSCLT